MTETLDADCRRGRLPAPRDREPEAIPMNDVDVVLAVIGDNLDRICSLEMRPRGSSHAVIHRLYDAARQVTGEALTMAAARHLAERVKSGDFVLITTGAGHPVYLPHGETDGPLGAVALARMLAEGIGAVPVMLTEQQHVENLRATAVAGGLTIRGLDEVASVAGSTTILPFPDQDEPARQVALDLLTQIEPAAVIAIEKLGPNAAGVAHTATGMAASTDRARIEHLIDAARERGILTVGIGDNGNEIGFGLIEDAVREYKPFGRTCRCPCGEGLACVVATDLLVVAGTSNWGAYGVEAALAAVLGRPDLIHDRRTEEFMLYENVRAGGIDGSTARQVPGVDGTSPAVQAAIVELMTAVVRHGLAEPSARPF
jgi:D-glutamate cyclase